MVSFLKSKLIKLYYLPFHPSGHSLLRQLPISSQSPSQLHKNWQSSPIFRMFESQVPAAQRFPPSKPWASPIRLDLFWASFCSTIVTVVTWAATVVTISFSKHRVTKRSLIKIKRKILNSEILCSAEFQNFFEKNLISLP